MSINMGKIVFFFGIYNPLLINFFIIQHQFS